MNIEIERKFLIKELPSVFEETINIKQYYLSNNDNMVQRLRIFNKEKAIISFKEKTSKMSKYEFEYNIPLEDAHKMISIANVPFIDKKRHIIHIDSLKWEIDEFLDKNKGLIIAEVELTHPGVYSDYKDLAVSQIFPSGWEIRNSRMDLVQSSKKDEITYQDVKDDRVYTYLDLKRNETKIFKIKLNASYLGKYYLPIVNCEAMYDNKISSNKGGQWVEVIE